MLTAVQNGSATVIIARDAQKCDGPFLCRSCGRDVILKKGNIYVHHFAHTPPIFCKIGAPESEVHLQCKLALFDHLSHEHAVSELELEKDFGPVISDLFVRINGAPVAIEVQRSNLSVASITERTAHYERLGIFVLWIALQTPALLTERYIPKAWERWCHAAYFGRVFYWLGGLNFMPVHFGGLQTLVEEKTIFQRGGIERSVGGYTKFAKLARRPLFGPVANLMQFRRTLQPGFSRGTIEVPRCRIFYANQKQWWA